MKRLNVLNGEALKEYFTKNFDGYAEDIISFNECLVDGELHENIFSKEFFSIRENFITEYFEVSAEVYKEKSINELKPLLDNRYVLSNKYVICISLLRLCEVQGFGNCKYYKTGLLLFQPE